MKIEICGAPSKRQIQKRDFPKPILPVLPYRFHYSLHASVNVWLRPLRVLSDRVRFRVLYRAPSDRVLFKVLLTVLSDSILYRFLSPRFLLCRVPSVTSTTWGVLQWFSVLNISVATDVLILPLWCLMQLPDIWASFWKEKKSFILDFRLGSE